MTDVKDRVKTLHSTAGPSLGSNSCGTFIELRICRHIEVSSLSPAIVACVIIHERAHVHAPNHAP